MSELITSLYQFPLQTEDALRAQGLVDPSRPTQLWFDPSAAGLTGVVNYATYSLSTLGRTSFDIPAAWAAKPNVFGLKQYPKYVIVPTNATMQASDKSAPPTGIDPGMLSTLAEAEMLSEVFGSAAISEGPPPLHYTINWADETRRPWQLSINGAEVNVGQLLQAQNANGVGAPGHWDGTNWVNDQQALGPEPPQSPIPMNLLPAGKVLQHAAIGDDIWVVDAPSAPASGTPGSGGLTAADRDQLNRIESGINALKGVFHLP